MPVGSDVRTPGGIRAALLALLVEGGFGGNFLDAGLFPVLDNMTVHVRDGGDGVATALAEGEIVRPGSRRAVGARHGRRCRRPFTAARFRADRLLDDPAA